MKKSKSENVALVKKYEKRSQFRDVMQRVLKNKGAFIGLCLFAIVLLCFLYGLIFIDYREATVGVVSDRLKGPSAQYPFGTDNMGRDLLSRIFYGARFSLAIGFGGSAIAATIGISLGCISGYYGGAYDMIIMRLTDVITSIPGILLGMVIISTLGSSLPNLIITVGVTSIPMYIRMTRASIMSWRNQEFVEAARAIGLPSLRIVFRQVLPNGLSPVIISFAMNLGGMILVSSGLSFLGLGIQAPLPEWGTLISGGRTYMRNAPWLLNFPGIFIIATVLAFNMLGDGLRDAIDPKLKR